MPKTPSLGRCIKITCFWYILKQAVIWLKDCAGVRKTNGHFRWTSTATNQAVNPSTWSNLPPPFTGQLITSMKH